MQTDPTDAFFKVQPTKINAAYPRCGSVRTRYTDLEFWKFRLGCPYQRLLPINECQGGIGGNYSIVPSHTPSYINLRTTRRNDVATAPAPIPSM